MSNDLNVTLVQTKIHWQSPEENMLWFESRLEHLYGKTDLIILPEMFTTGFSMEPGKFAEKPEGKAMKWMQDVASKYKAAVVGTLMMEENGAFFKRLTNSPPSTSHALHKAAAASDETEQSLSRCKSSGAPNIQYAALS